MRRSDAIILTEKQKPTIERDADARRGDNSELPFIYVSPQGH